MQDSKHAKKPKRPQQPKACKRLPMTATAEERLAAHKAKMVGKAERRRQWYATYGNQPFPTNRWTKFGFAGFPAGINRHTCNPHEHRREIARRVGRKMAGRALA